MTRPIIITRRGPHRSDRAPDAQAASPAATPYTVNNKPTLPSLSPRSPRKTARYPDSTPSPIMKISNPT